MNHKYGLDLKCSGIGALVAALAVMAMAAPSPGLAAELEQIALEADAQGAVLTLSLSAPVAQHVFRLRNPDRLVIDLPDTRRRVRLPQPPEGGVVAGLRSGMPDGRALRLVAELRSPVRPQVQRLAGADGYQLRIALIAAPGAAPAPLLPTATSSPVTAAALAPAPTAPTAPQRLPRCAACAPRTHRRPRANAIS